jgi:hypothetical protein
MFFRKNDWKNSLVSVFETPACCVCCRPFREFDLANNRRLDPTATLHFRGGLTLGPIGCARVPEDFPYVASLR